jgi:alkylhydroperoxidase/carboxymuconolactone decarboxylase family protein YurZ
VCAAENQKSKRNALAKCDIVGKRFRWCSQPMQKEPIMPNPLSAMYKLDPGLQSHMDAVNKFVYSEGALPRKYKLIIALAFDAAHGAELGVKSLAASAMQAGATKEEIVEAVRVAYLLSGVPALFTASQGLAGLAGEA